jgi:hypothetical protein
VRRRHAPHRQAADKGENIALKRPSRLLLLDPLQRSGLEYVGVLGELNGTLCMPIVRRMDALLDQPFASVALLLSFGKREPP